MKIAIKNWEPQGEWLLCHRTMFDKIGSVLIPETATGATGQRAKVIVESVGPDVDRCKPGDYILILGSGECMEADPNDENRFLITNESVMAVVEYTESVIEVPGIITRAQA